MILLTVILLSAVCMDLKTYRIPNRLIMAGGISGLLWNLVSGLYQGLDMKRTLVLIIIRLSLAALMLFCLMPLWQLGAFGGGDVKLLCVCVIHIGFGKSVNSLLYALCFGVLLTGIHQMLRFLFPDNVKPLETKNHMHRIHFSLPIFLGVLCQHLGGMLIQIPF